VARYLARRIVFSVVVLFVVVTVTFFGVRLTSDPVEQLSAVGASTQDIQAVRHSLGYDRPIGIQYVEYLGKLARGDLGISLRYQQSNLTLIEGRLPYTAELAGAALLLTVLFAIPLGVVAAARRDRTADRGIQGFVALGQAVPNFVVGPLLILLFAVHLHWVPVAGVQGLGSIALPAVTLAIYPISQIARVLRASMLEVWHADYVTTARAKGLAESTVVSRHMLRNALVPMITLLGLQVAALLGGAVIVESIFGWPGLGRFAVQALLGGDYSLAQAIVVVMTAIVVLVNLATDLAYSFIDPRIKLR
jgi:peptide/nickel transport system permease protein